MKVLQFFPSLSERDGGTTTYMQQLAVALAPRVELHLCVLTDLEACAPIPGAHLHRIELRLAHLWQMRRQWLAVLDEVGPDVVHINCCWMPQCALVQYWTRHYSRRKGRAIRLVITPHGMLEPWLVQRNYWTRKLPAIVLYQRWAVRNADAIIATAEAEREHLCALGWAKTGRIQLVPNGIDVASIRLKGAGTFRRSPRLSLLFMSRLHPKKGLEQLIKALPEGVELKIAGEGDEAYAQHLRREVAALSKDGQCRFLGPVYGEEKWQLIRAADIVVLPSFSENFGLIVAEALASGVPVLTTEGTPWQQLCDLRCGWWVRPEVESLRRALEEALRLDAPALEEMGRRGRRLVEEHYSSQVQADRLMRIYEKISN